MEEVKNQEEGIRKGEKVLLSEWKIQMKNWTREGDGEEGNKSRERNTEWKGKQNNAEHQFGNIICLCLPHPYPLPSLFPQHQTTQVSVSGATELILNLVCVPVC